MAIGKLFNSFGRNRSFTGTTSGEDHLLSLSEGDVVGLVILTPGAPEEREEVFGYLYWQYLDELAAASGPRSRIRDFFSKLLASRSLARATEQIAAIGGGEALNLLTQNQSTALLSAVQKKNVVSGIHFRSYVAARFGSLSATQAVSQMRADGVNKVIFVPLFPPYVASLCEQFRTECRPFEHDGAFEGIQAVCVPDVFDSEGFARATSDRIEQALQRFPASMREKVHILFAARWSGQSSAVRQAAEIPHQVIETVSRIVNVCPADLTHSIGHLDSGRLRPGGRTSVRTRLHELREENRRALLVVPVDHISDQLESAYRIDVLLRAQAREFGVAYYQVASAVNCHQLFINGLADQILNRFNIVPKPLPVVSPDREPTASVRQEEKYA